LKNATSLRKGSKIDKNRKKRAFTLIELLVVISIISLLLGILLPALHRVKESAKLTLCLNNMRQMGMGVAAYAGSNSDIVLPSARNGDWQLRYPGNTDATLGGPPWYERLKSSGLLDYTEKQTGILHCPSDKRDPGFCSYSANRYLMGFTDPRNNDEKALWPVRKMSALHGNLSRLILFGERGAVEDKEWAMIGGEWSMGGASVTIYGGYAGQSYVGFYLGRHGNAKLPGLKKEGGITGARVPFVMADGHAKAFIGEISGNFGDGTSETTGFELDRVTILEWPGKSWPKLSDIKKENDF